MRLVRYGFVQAGDSEARAGITRSPASITPGTPENIDLSFEAQQQRSGRERASECAIQAAADH